MTADLLRRSVLGILIMTATMLAMSARASAMSDRERRCLTLIAYAEAAGEGTAGMAAVMRVVRNRVADPRFAGDACAVILEAGQFQPVAERPALRRALEAPERTNLAEVLGANSRAARRTLIEAWRLAALVALQPHADPTGGALYFVNPRLMDPAKCAWFAGLRRTAAIGEHVFMAHYRATDRRGPPAIDCSMAGRDFAGTRRLARRDAIGPLDPDGAKITPRTATPAMLRAWRRTGEFERRQAMLKRHFRSGWYHGEEAGSQP